MNNQLLIPIHSISNKPGEMKEINLTVDQHPEFHTDLIKVAADEPLEISGRLESVSQGILATLLLRTTAIGECSRCLDPIEFDCEEEITQLYFYAQKPARAQKSKSQNEVDDEDSEEILYVEQEAIDLEPVIRDALLLQLPLNPLCKDECEGLCPSCGEKWENLPANHKHELIDPRWGALEKLKGQEE